VARLDLNDIHREHVKAILDDAKANGKEKKSHLRQELVRLHPGLDEQTIVRNGKVYKAIEYLIDDLGSYGD
jgi:hypothetical protein